MNSQRTTYNDLLLTSLAYNNNYLNAYWLLGFIEGEGTFGIKSNVPYFQIAQHNRNRILMLAISIYLQKIIASPSNLNSPDLRLNMSTNKATDVLTLAIVNIDTLYDQILPLFSTLFFYTRKQIDF